MNRGALRGLGPAGFIPDYLGPRIAGADGSVLVADSTALGAARLSPITALTTGGVASAASIAPSFLLAPSNNGVETVTLDQATTTFQMPTGTVSGVPFQFNLLLTQDGTGGRLAAWPGTVAWTNGVAPTLQTAAAAVDGLSFLTVNGGTNWYGTYVPKPATTPLPWWGDGSDGTVTISGATTLTKDMYYDSLTVNSAINLNTAGFDIFVKNTLTNNGTIRSVGLAGAAPTAGAGITTGYFRSSAGGAGGAAGAVGVVGVASTSSGAAFNGGGAGGGGAGGNSSTHNGAAGGAATAPVSDHRRGGYGALLNDMDNTGVLVAYKGGAGGGGGGGDVSAAGGGGGGAGGLVVIFARVFATNNAISAAGGAGGTPAAGTTGPGGGGGGGGGGILVHSTSPQSGTLNVNGGAAGTSQGSATVAVAGNAGSSLWIQWGQ